MNRRSFLKALSSLPFVGGLFAVGCTALPKKEARKLPVVESSGYDKFKRRCYLTDGPLAGRHDTFLTYCDFKEYFVYGEEDNVKYYPRCDSERRHVLNDDGEILMFCSGGSMS